MADITEKAIQEVVKLARAGVAAQTVKEGNVPFAVIPDGTQLVSLEKYVYNDHADRPERIRQSVTVLDPDAFVKYYSLYSDSQSRVFAYEPKSEVVAVLDYHAAGEGAARWCQHKVTLSMRASEEWKIWTGKNNQQFSQIQFAEFLEQNAVDIYTPDPAHIMDVARDLEGTTEVQFGAGIRMNNGQVRFKYTEETKTTVGGSQVEVPERFALSIPVYIGGPRIPIEALLRFRVKEGRLVFWFTLVRPEEILRKAFIQSRDQIASTLGIGIINGTLG